MDMSFGARLREHRERRSVALATIATETKIKIGLLEGLERDDISHWPGGIFRRSYLRAYAEAIGLDADAVIREFLALYPDPTDEASAVEVMANAVPRRRPPTRLTYLINSAISALPSLRSPAPPRSPAMAVDEPPDVDEVVMPTSVVAPGFSLALTAAMPTPGNGSAHPDLLDTIDIDQPRLDLGDDLPFAPRCAEAFVLRHGLEVAHDAEPPRQDLFAGIAELCTRLGRVCDAREVLPVLEEATSMLNAIGLILWTWDPRARALRPALSHGYSAALLSQVPPVEPDSDNAIGLAFRSAETRIVNGDDQATGALAVPLMTPSGCAGVLAAEFRDSVEQLAWVRAVVTILAAQLSMLVGPPAALRAATA